jgi:hypothetical protein
LPLYRDLAAHDATYRSDLAGTLNNLGVLYVDTRRLADADKTLDEALSIRRDLATHDPGGPGSPRRSIISESFTSTPAVLPTPTRHWTRR